MVPESGPLCMSVASGQSGNTKVDRCTKVRSKLSGLSDGLSCRQEPRAGPSDKPEDKDNTIILTSTFVDSTPRSTTGAARPQRQEKSTGDAKSKESSLDPAMRDMLRKRGS